MSLSNSSLIDSRLVLLSILVLDSVNPHFDYKSFKLRKMKLRFTHRCNIVISSFMTKI